MNKKMTFVKILKQIFVLVVASVIVITVTNCTKSYDIIFINYKEHKVYISDDLTNRDNMKIINPKGFFVLKRGFMTGIGNLTYYVLNDNYEKIFEFNFEYESLKEKYIVYNDELIIIEVK